MAEVGPNQVTTLIRSKAKSERSPLGRLLGRVATIRIENEGGWDAGPWSLTLVLVLEDGELPTLPGDPTGPGASETAPAGMAAIATLITDLGPGASELANLWLAFCEAFATEALVGSRISRDIVSEFLVEAVEESEFSYARQGYPSEPTSLRQGVSRQGRLARGRSKLVGRRF